MSFVSAAGDYVIVESLPKQKVREVARLYACDHAALSKALLTARKDARPGRIFAMRLSDLPIDETPIESQEILKAPAKRSRRKD